MSEQVEDMGGQYLAEGAESVVPEGYKLTEVGVIPEDWEIEKLENIVTFRNGAAHENDIDEVGVYIVVNSRYISTEGAVVKRSNEKRQPAYKNDVLMVMSDVPNGRAIAKCYFADENEKYTINQRICSISSESAEPKYLFYKLNRNPYFLAFDDGVKQTNLRRQDVLNVPIPLPLKKEQTAIATALFVSYSSFRANWAIAIWAIGTSVTAIATLKLPC